MISVFYRSHLFFISIYNKMPVGVKILQSDFFIYKIEYIDRGVSICYVFTNTYVSKI